MTETNAFEQLLKWLDDGTLGHNHIQIAYRAHVRNSKVLPEAIKGLLGGTNEGDVGILFTVFKLISFIQGNMELAYRRGYQAGLEVSKHGNIGQEREKV